MLHVGIKHLAALTGANGAEGEGDKVTNPPPPSSLAPSVSPDPHPNKQHNKACDFAEHEHFISGGAAPVCEHPRAPKHINERGDIYRRTHPCQYDTCQVVTHSTHNRPLGPPPHQVPPVAPIKLLGCQHHSNVWTSRHKCTTSTVMVCQLRMRGKALPN